MTCMLSKSVLTYLAKRGEDSKQFNLCIPANIRWQMYEKYDDVKLENKFAPIALRIPIISDFTEAAIKKIKGATA